MLPPDPSVEPAVAPAAAPAAAPAIPPVIIPNVAPVTAPIYVPKLVDESDELTLPDTAAPTPPDAVAPANAPGLAVSDICSNAAELEPNIDEPGLVVDVPDDVAVEPGLVAEPDVAVEPGLVVDVPDANPPPNST